MCQNCLPSNVKEPFIQKPMPDRPFQEIAVDYINYAGRDSLVIVDCFTDCPAAIPMAQGIATTQLIIALH